MLAEERERERGSRKACPIIYAVFQKYYYYYNTITTSNHLRTI